MSLLREGGFVVEKDGATWFRWDAGDDEDDVKDNVLIRSSGEQTYFATDVAYHYDKFLRRGFDRVIDVWGADHHGHVARTKAAVSAVGGDGERLEVLLYQLVHLRRGTASACGCPSAPANSSRCANWSKRWAPTRPAFSCSSARPTRRWISTSTPRYRRTRAATPPHT